MTQDPTDPDPTAEPPSEHPDGHEGEVLADSPEQAAALVGAAGDDPGEGAPWADGPEHVGSDGLPEPSPAGESGGAEGHDGSDGSEEVMPLSVEGVGDLVADPLSRAKVIARDDPGGPAADEVPPSPS